MDSGSRYWFHFLWLQTLRKDCGSYGSSICRFLRILHIVCHNAYTNLIYIPTNSLQGFPFHHILGNACYYLFIYLVEIAIQIGVRWYLTVVSIRASPNTVHVCLTTKNAVDDCSHISGAMGLLSPHSLTHCFFFSPIISDMSCSLVGIVPQNNNNNW